MSGEQYAVLAYAVGLGLVAAYSARLWIIHRTLARRERAAPEAPAETQAPRLGSLKVQAPVRVDVRTGEPAPTSAHV